MRPIRTAALLLPLAACAHAPGQPPAPPAPAAEAPCRNEGLERFTGQRASSETGADLLKASGAHTLRWAAPDSAMTMDFRPDRLTVSYDRTMTITTARCG